MQTFKDWDALHLGWQTAEDIWNAAVEAARADLLKPSPCGHKFADGTPHPKACWKLADCCDGVGGPNVKVFDGEKQVPGHADYNSEGPCDFVCNSHCLICDSEAKRAAETERQFEIADSLIREECKQLQVELTTLRAAMKDADDRAEVSNESVLDDNELLQNKVTALREGLREKILGLSWIPLVYRQDVIRHLTPPAASGPKRDGEEGQKS